MPTPDLLVSRSLLTGALAASLLTACASDLPHPPSIIDGAPDYEHTSVVRISWGDGIHTGSTCSGTYIGAGRVLTALHCVPSDSSETISVTFVNYHDTYGDSAQVETEAHDETPPDPSGDGLARVVVSDSDVAALPFAVPPMSILPASAAPLSHSDRFTAIGFGATTAPTVADPQGAGYDTRHKGQVSLSEFTGEMVRVVDGPDGAAPCNGDSGGPLVVTRAGVDSLVGVLLNGDCATEMQYMRADLPPRSTFVDSPVTPPSFPTIGCSSSASCSSGSPLGALGALGVVLVVRWRRSARPERHRSNAQRPDR